MGAVLAQNLPSIAFSKNAIVLKLQSDDWRATAPAISVNTLAFTAAVANGDQIVLAWPGGSAIMTAAAVPDNSGNQFPSGAGDNAHILSLVSYFQNNYFIDQAYTVTADTSGANPKLVFTALAASADYNFSAGTNQVVVTPGTTGSPKPNFMHHIEVWKKNTTGPDTKVYDANVALDEPRTGSTTLDLSESLHSFMRLDNPSLSGYWQICTKSCFQYYVKFAQFYGATPAIQKLTRTGLYTVVYGGYSNLALEQITDRVNYLANYLLPDPALYMYQRWLESWPIDNISLKTNHPKFLYFVNNRSVDEGLSVKVDITFADLTTSSILLAGGTLPAGKKIAVGCGYQQLGLPTYNNPLNNITGYSITLVKSDTQESRSLPKSFTINRDYEAYTRYFLYNDSAGNFKTLRTYGKSNPTSDVEFDLTAFQPDVATLPDIGNYRNSNIKAVINDSLSTGYIAGRGIYDAIVELQYAKQVFRVFGSKLAPVVITSKKFPFSADGNNISAFTLEYRLAYDEDLYTADSSALPIPSINQSQQAINDL